MKQRFSSLDVKIIAHELQERLVSLRLSNVYDLSSKILLLKFAKPDNKKQLVIDTGFRCHLTKFARTTAAAPSVFVARLRKFLKTRRLTSVRQVGTDRVLELEFSDGQYRLFLEFFASGNIILTDADLNILALARTVSEGEGQEPQRVGLQYSLENRQNYGGIPPLTKERVQNALKTAVEKAAAATPSSKKHKVKPGGDLRKGLAVSITELPPVLVDHWLHSNNFDTTVKPDEILANEALLDDLVKFLQEARQIVQDLTSSEICTGYIFAKRKEKPESTEVNDDETKTKRDLLLYEDFHPFVPYKLKNDPTIEVLEFKGYNETVDEFFSSLEGQRLESRLSEREAVAKRKLEAAKNEQNRRIEGLQEAQTLNFRKAAAIEANAERVQEAMDAVNGLLNQGMDWVDIGKLVEREKKRHNPVAEIIKLPLNLAENLITLELAEEEFEPEEDDPYETDDDDSAIGDDEGSSAAKGKQNSKALNVEINLGLSPWSNAREYFDQRKSAASKEEKTQQQASRALKNAEQKINEDLKKGLKQEKALLQPIRKQMWFEKFIWFISSDGYLVIGGKDAQQNEIVYKKYLRKGDIYCHADLHGASSVIVKNNPQTPDAPIPPATLSQAGSLAVCSSSAWDSKAGMSAWWVNADQVSKSAPTGEFLPAGSFMIRGKKNFLPPAQLLLGLGIAFKISEESKAKHVKHRLHGVDSAIGDEVSGAATPQSAEKTGDVGEVEAEESDVPSETDSEDEQPDAESRDNPLQAFGLESHNDEVEEAEEGVSELKISDDTADETHGQDEGEADEKEVDEDEDDESAESHNDTSSKPVEAKPKNDTPNSKKKAPPKRGQKGKAKKIAAKYKHQDEDDRAAAEALIGATIGQKKAEAEVKAKEDRQAELAAAKERRRAQHQRQQKETAEHEEIRRVMMEEGVEMLDEDEASQMTVLDALVGMPLPGDEILEIVPVCAPWNALGRYKYKAKLQPGATKKGKAVKEVLDRWKAAPNKKGVVDESARDSERMWPREVELIKALKPEETFNVVPVSKVRVLMAGGNSGGGGGGGKKGAKGKGGRGRGSKK
ncbi:related to RNA-binding protein homologous to eukaryotic snRNP [Fusarium torulosum]|uniref:Ribosome quality control complex subunit 2 n=1 Tax=Fusarium torulosum TaxID=33205 RepID=A0AAE8MH51_9HYPO|nr:related to RNA-binding protein homologous to eukaryotic snRNP [Fusarium torulosum]